MGDAYNKIIDIHDRRHEEQRPARGRLDHRRLLPRSASSRSGVKWAHLDIAGMVWSDKAGHLYDKGATGFGVALLDRYLADNHEG